MFGMSIIGSSRCLVLAALAIATCAVACGSSDDGTDAADDADDGVSLSSEQDLSGNAIRLGYAGGHVDVLENPGFQDLFTTTKGAKHSRLCHTYTSWNVLEHVGDASVNGSHAHWDAWHKAAVDDNCEIMVTFQSDPTNGVDPKEEPTVDQFENSFKAFRAAYPDIHVFTTWNEPNNGHASGDGLDHALPAETAARYYLALRRNCRPKDGCLVSTPDVLGWHDANSFQMRCSKNPDDLCKDGSYLDQLKYYIDRDAKAYGQRAGFRPEFVAVHPWNDSFRYTDDGSHCSDAATCVTKAALENLGGSWSKSFLWMTEVGVHSDKGDATQACGGAFLQRLFASSPRITRFYYYSFCRAEGDGDVSLVDSGPGNTCGAGTKARPIMEVLRDRKQNYSSECK
jgi:hypothetical protein